MGGHIFCWKVDRIPEDPFCIIEEIDLGLGYLFMAFCVRCYSIWALNAMICVT